MATIVITGSNAGVGWDACRQLALLPDTPSTPKVGKIVLTCRSAEKAQDAIERLVAAGCARELFSFVVLDLDSPMSVNHAVGALPPTIDKLCLNACLFDAGMHPSGLTKTAMSLVGDAVLVDGLLAAGKLSAGATVLYVGAELTRPIASFSLAQLHAWGYASSRTCCNTITDSALEAYPVEDVCGCIPSRGEIQTYANAKVLGHLYFSNMARKRPDIHWLNTSPGPAVPTTI